MRHAEVVRDPREQRADPDELRAQRRRDENERKEHMYVSAVQVMRPRAARSPYMWLRRVLIDSSTSQE